MIKDKLLERWISEIQQEIDELYELKEILLSKEVKESYSGIVLPMANAQRVGSIGENIRNRRKAMGISQYELADAVGISVPMVCQIERGTKSVTLQLGAEMAKALECDINDFISK